jgi:hypothetical protein
LRRSRPGKEQEREREIKEGDKNIAYLFAKANQRRRKKSIACLEEEGVTITDNEGMIRHALEFYKKLFGEKNRQNIKMDEAFWDEAEKVTPKENNILESGFLEEEVKRVVDESYAEGTSGPDGFSFSILLEVLDHHEV